MIQCDILKERSYIGCLRDSFDLMCANFVHILRRTWWSAALLAVLLAVSMTVTNEIVDAVATVASIVVASMLCACCLNEVVEVGRRKLFLRTLKSYVLTIVVMLLFCIVALLAAVIITKFAPTAKQPAAAPSLLPYVLTTVATFVVMIVVLIPTFYSTMKYVVDDSTKLSSIYGGNYKKGWRSWGQLFIALLLIALIVIVVVGIMLLPLIVLIFAEGNNTKGVMLGDASALPSGFVAMRFIAALVAAFFNAYMTVWAVYAQYLIFVHIEAKLAKKENTQQA